MMKLRIRKHEESGGTEEDSDRTEILERLAKAVSGRSNRIQFDASPKLYADIQCPLTLAFKENAEKVSAQVTLVNYPEELSVSLAEMISENGWKEIVCAEKPLRDLLDANNFPFECRDILSETTEVAITGCEYLVADLGSVIVSSAQSGSRKIFVYPPVHIVVAFSSQLVETLEEGYNKTVSEFGDNLPSMISIITGPSRTADIEKTLVLGAHGPKKLHIFILDLIFSENKPN
jgi:L-lactate dehydrogenase complex protein LldG